MNKIENAKRGPRDFERGRGRGDRSRGRGFRGRGEGRGGEGRGGDRRGGEGGSRGGEGRGSRGGQRGGTSAAVWWLLFWLSIQQNLLIPNNYKNEKLLLYGVKFVIRLF